MVSVDINKPFSWSQPDFKDQKEEGTYIIKQRVSLL